MREENIMSLNETEFFEKLNYIYLGKSKVWQHIKQVCWYIIMAACCSIPAQDTWSQNEEVFVNWLPAAIAVGVGFATSSCVGQFRTYSEQNIKNNVGSVLELLQYHPVDKVKLQKQKVKYQFQFLVKLSLICLLVQLLAAYLSMGRVEWLNVAYIFIVVFLIPGIFEIFASWVKIKVLYGG